MKRRGLDNVKMIWHGETSDPELEYNGIVANYWTVEDWLYGIFEEDMKEQGADPKKRDNDEVFNHWLKDNFYIVEEVFENYKSAN